MAGAPKQRPHPVIIPRWGTLARCYRGSLTVTGEIGIYTQCRFFEFLPLYPLTGIGLPFSSLSSAKCHAMASAIAANFLRAGLV